MSSKLPLLRAVRVWDLPTRLNHWTLALTVVASVLTAQIGGNAMAWHIRLGQLVLALLVFRFAWGFVGGYWSRFATFLYSPRSLLAYLRGDRGTGGRFEIGHSPIGALSVFALYGLLALQVATGLVADDEIATAGPLNRFVSAATARIASAWHTEAGQVLLILLVCLHIGAVAFYRWRRQRPLTAAMMHGDKWLPAETPASADGLGARLKAAVLMLAAVALAWWIGRFGAG
jgi:cytochrome b